MNGSSDKNRHTFMISRMKSTETLPNVFIPICGPFFFRPMNSKKKFIHFWDVMNQREILMNHKIISKFLFIFTEDVDLLLLRSEQSFK